VSDKQYDFGVFIGRFQPFHKGHLQVVLAALEQCRNLVILLGSANRGRDTRNPFTASERAAVIADCLEEAGVLERCEIADLPDHPYDMQAWIAGVQSAVKDCTHPDSKIALTGHDRDNSSFYLKKFPNWAFIMPTTDLVEINATAIRTAFFNGDLTEEFEPKLLSWLPEPSLRFLKTFRERDEWFPISTEQYRERKYREQWGKGPFMTADAVVIQSGHLLVVERGGDIGKGKLALPGGHLNVDETLDQAAVRELFEETELFGDCQSVEEAANKLWPHFRGREMFDDVYRSPRARVITTAFLFKLPDAFVLPRVKGSDDAARAFWMPVGDIKPELFFEDHYFVIERMKRYL
jgi:cytidyltransferase-related domain